MSLDQRIRKLNHRRIDQMRAFKLSLARIIFTPLSKFKKQESGDCILVFRLDGKLGDNVTATGFLKTLKTKYPQNRLIVATNLASASIYQQLDFIDQVVTAEKGLLQTLKLWFLLKKNQYQFLINTSHILTPRVIMLVSLLRSYKKITFANHNFKSFSDAIDIDFKKDHVTQRYQKVLSLLGIKEKIEDYQLPVSEKALADTKSWLQSLRKNGTKIIALNSFAGAHLRNLSQKTTKKIVSELLKIENTVVLSLANQGDHSILSYWMAADPQPGWVHAPQFSSLQHNIALLSQCDLIITPDTAWVHLASALKVKLVAIYREDTSKIETNSVIWSPYQTQSKIVFARARDPLPDDINNLDVSEVIKQTNSLLGDS